MEVVSVLSFLVVIPLILGLIEKLKDHIIAQHTEERKTTDAACAAPR